MDNIDKNMALTLLSLSIFHTLLVFRKGREIVKNYKEITFAHSHGKKNLRLKVFIGEKTKMLSSD